MGSGVNIIYCSFLYALFLSLYVDIDACGTNERMLSLCVMLVRLGAVLMCSVFLGFI